MGVVITVHELGHYYAGRLYGAAVESFSVGFGKSIAEKKDSRGTRWRINRFPLGGFVKFIGENQTADDVGKNDLRPDIIGKPFTHLTAGQRSVIAIAGPMANFVLAVVLMGFVVYANGKDKSTLVVTQVSGAPSIETGFQIGDQIQTVAGKNVDERGDLQTPVLLGTGNQIPVILWPVLSPRNPHITLKQ